MLESYDREIRSLEGSLMEAEENLDNTRCGGRAGHTGGGSARLPPCRLAPPSF